MGKTIRVVNRTKKGYVDAPRSARSTEVVITLPPREYKRLRRSLGMTRPPPEFAEKGRIIRHNVLSPTRRAARRAAREALRAAREEELARKRFAEDKKYILKILRKWLDEAATHENAQIVDSRAVCGPRAVRRKAAVRLLPLVRQWLLEPLKDLVTRLEAAEK